jgi:hypothetical protein
MLEETGILTQPIEEGEGHTLSTMAATTTGMKDLSINPKDVGLPADGLWDHDAAYEERFCSNHGEVEYLLSTPNRWMLPRDFDIAAAEDELNALFQKFHLRPSEFQPYSPRCQAECASTLWSQIESVVNRRPFGEETAYCARWKVCWTPRSCVDKIEWALESLEANTN